MSAFVEFVDLEKFVHNILKEKGTRKVGQYFLFDSDGKCGKPVFLIQFNVDEGIFHHKISNKYYTYLTEEVKVEEDPIQPFDYNAFYGAFGNNLRSQVENDFATIHNHEDLNMYDDLIDYFKEHPMSTSWNRIVILNWPLPLKSRTSASDKSSQRQCRLFQECQ